MKNIVILDVKTLGNLNFECLEKYGKITRYQVNKGEDISDKIKDAHIILTNKVELNETNLQFAKNLELICVTATGFNNIDIKYARENNIAVTNVAGYSTNTVAQHTLATVLALFDNILYYDNYVKSGTYAKSGIFTDVSKTFYELEGKTWGIIGFGAIGKKVAKLAEAFGANIIYYSTSGKNSNSEYKRVEFNELLKTSDVISIHAPLNDITKGLINYEALSKMKSTAILSNMGRGPIIVEEDLAKALDENLIAGASLDVFEFEPIKENNTLMKIKDTNKLICSPHIGWASLEARNRLLLQIDKNIEAFYKGEKRSRVEL